MHRIKPLFLLLFVLLIVRCSKTASDERIDDKLRATTDYYANIGLSQDNQYLSKGDCELAIRSFQRAISYNPQLAPAHCNPGYLYYVKGKHEDAESKSKKNIEIEPRYVGAYFYLAELYDKRGMVYEAIEQY